MGSTVEPLADLAERGPSSSTLPMNDWSKVIPKIMAMALMALREEVPWAMAVNRAYEPLAGEQGTTINVPIPSAAVATAVVPSHLQTAYPDSAPTSVNIELDQWFESGFGYTDKEEMEIERSVIPAQMSECIRALANKMNVSIAAKVAKFYGIAGTAGTTPFADISSATDARVVLNKQLAPLDPRFFIVDPDAEGKALQLRAFHDASFGVGGNAIMNGQIDRRLGFRWLMSQLVQRHTAGTGAGYLTNGTLAAGTKTIPADTGTGTILVGDIVKFAGHTQTYVVTSALSGGSFAIEPGLVVAVGNNVVITSPGDTAGIKTHVLNTAMHRDAIAFATRPLAGSRHPGAIVEVQSDAKSGLTMRLEVTRQNRQDKIMLDALWGVEVVRREYGMRLLG